MSDPRPQHQATPGAMIPSASPGFPLIAAVFLVTLLVYALFSYRVMVYTEPPTGDQPFYLMTAISLTHDGDIEESNNYALQNERLFYPQSYENGFQGIPAPFPLPPHNGKTTARPASEMYSKHGLGLSLLIIPGWLAGENLTAANPGWLSLPPFSVDLSALQIISGGWPSVIYELNILGALLAVQVLLLAWEVTRSKGIALAVVAAFAFSNPQMTYSYLIFPELPAGLLTIYAFRRLLMGIPANNLPRLLLVGAAIGFLPWLHTRYLPITLALMALAFVQWRRLARPKVVAPEAEAPPPTVPNFEPVLDGVNGTPIAALAAPVAVRAVAVGPAPRRFTGSLIMTLAPVIVSGLALMVYYQLLYGLPLPNTQDHAGFINPLDDPLGIPVSIIGLLLDQQWGLLVFAPVYVLAFVGIVAMARDPERRRLLFWLLITTIPYYLFVAAYRQWWGEWCPPARYLATITPLMALPIAESLRVLRDQVLYKAIFFVLSAFGWLMMAGLIAHPRGMFNHPSGQAELFLWFQQQLGLNLVPFFPAVVRWAFWHGYGLNWALLIAWTFICLALVLFGVLVLPNARRGEEQPS